MGNDLLLQRSFLSPFVSHNNSKFYADLFYSIFQPILQPLNFISLNKKSSRTGRLSTVRAGSDRDGWLRGRIMK